MESVHCRTPFLIETAFKAGEILLAVARKLKIYLAQKLVDERRFIVGYR